MIRVAIIAFMLTFFIGCGEEKRSPSPDYSKIHQDSDKAHKELEKSY